LEDVLYEGRIDRLVLMREGGILQKAEVLDFKTNRLDSRDEAGLARAARAYRGQMKIYRRAVAQLHGIPLASVRGTLVFLESGASLASED
jgi:ATP-dependent exoDNAse (exonuclease V) beta subunit